MSDSEGFNAGNSQFSLSERVARIHHTLTMSASSTISCQEAEFAASAVRFVFKLPLTFFFSICLITGSLVTPSSTCQTILSVCPEFLSFAFLFLSLSILDLVHNCCGDSRSVYDFPGIFLHAYHFVHRFIL